MRDVGHHAEAVHAALTASTGQDRASGRRRTSTRRLGRFKLDIGDGYDREVNLTIYGDGM